MEPNLAMHNQQGIQSHCSPLSRPASPLGKGHPGLRARPRPPASSTAGRSRSSPSRGTKPTSRKPDNPRRRCCSSRPGTFRRKLFHHLRGQQECCEFWTDSPCSTECSLSSPSSPPCCSPPDMRVLHSHAPPKSCLGRAFPYPLAAPTRCGCVSASLHHNSQGSLTRPPNSPTRNPHRHSCSSAPRQRYHRPHPRSRAPEWWCASSSRFRSTMGSTLSNPSTRTGGSLLDKLVCCTPPFR
mmetsp:Transcript_103612/g.246680  ORF Transcript_103612/g.246680 Transcript_103612/m.246680 type:complete len:240 (-) Transcript_103612:685-1404(-)